MKFEEFDCVRVLKDFGDEVKAGDLGAVVMVFDNPYEAYEVEFLDEDGYTKAIDTFLPTELEPAEA